jgi:ATP-binding cassette subfamily B protein
VEFREVNFAYKEQEVLKDFSLVIEGGQTTAFVGSSGSGKSTLVRLLLNLLKPQKGQVLVDDQDLREVNLTTYYPGVAYIPQEPPIFDGTLYENLTFERPVEPARLEEVIHQVGLAGLVGRLPKGLETLVGERGIKLSGGERQRLAFGRVLLQDPHIVILDEPTSALDSLTEDFITRSLIPFLKGKTVILVAHRLQTVQSADQIIVLEGGQIAQRGTFTTLVNGEGRFRQLWEKQAQMS